MEQHGQTRRCRRCSITARDRRDLDHLMAHGRWILSLQQGSAAAAGLRVMLHYLIHPLDRQQLRPRSRMGWLTAALAATALAPLRWLKPMAVTKGRIGGVARAAADPLPHTGQFAGQGGELAAELIVLLFESLNLLLLSEDQRSDTGWCCKPIRFCYHGRRGAHHRGSLPEMQTGIKLPSRVQEG